MIVEGVHKALAEPSSQGPQLLVLRDKMGACDMLQELGCEVGETLGGWFCCGRMDFGLLKCWVSVD